MLWGRLVTKVILCEFKADQCKWPKKVSTDLYPPFPEGWGPPCAELSQLPLSDMGCLGSPPTWCGSQVAADGFAWAQEGCWPCCFTLAVPISLLTWFFYSQDQCVGWVWTLRSRIWTARAVEPKDAAVEAFYSIQQELSALQLLLTQINVSFLSFYFLQSWHVAVLQSVGAVLSLELRNTFSPWFPGNSRPPHLCICYNNCVFPVPQHLSCVGFLPLSPSSISFPSSTSTAFFSFFSFFVWKTLLLYMHVPNFISALLKQ